MGSRSWLPSGGGDRRLALVALGVCGLLLASCSDGRSAADLYLVRFAQDQQTGVYRDQVLTFEFSARVDPTTIDLDTIQIRAGEPSSPTPFVGLFESDGRFVHFHPAVDEDDPGRGSLPVNPYGFAEYTEYRVTIPSVQDTPAPLRVLASRRGKPNRQTYHGAFTTGGQFLPDAAEGPPSFAPFEPAVHNVPGAPFPGTAEPHDDVLSYAPAPGPGDPPLHPVTREPDFRAEHPTHVRAQLTFTRVMDPRSFRIGRGGNVRLEFNSPGSEDWNPIPAAIAHAPNGRTFVVTAATPLAHADRNNRYRVVIDANEPAPTSRSGKPLVMAVEKWDAMRGRMTWADVTEPDLTFWCARIPGESGPLLAANFPLLDFARDDLESDRDVSFRDGRLDAGAVAVRTSEDVTPCVESYCSQALREPLTQSTASTVPNPNSKGPSKIQFLYNSPQHGGNQPAVPYRLANAEALVDMDWGPMCATVIKSTYPKLHIHVMWSDRNSTSSTPAGLASTTYDANFDRNPPGFAVRDGKTPYAVDLSSTNVPWYSWKLDRPFTDYRSDKGLVFMAWTEVGGDTEQFVRWYAPNNSPNTRVFNPPGPQPNPAVGMAGQWCYYWTRFTFRRIRSLAVSRYFRLMPNETDRPLWHAALVSPSPADLPGGTAYEIQYRGGTFAGYSPQGGAYLRGEGAPLQSSAWSRDVAAMDELPAVAIRVVFTANPMAPEDLPYLREVAFTYRLK